MIEVVNFQAGQNIEYFRIEERTESDHLPIALDLRVQREEPLDTRKTRKELTDWSVEGIKEYKRNIGAMNKKLYESTNYEEFAKAVQSAQKVITIKGRGKGQRWWDEECWEEKKKLRKSLRSLRSGKTSAEEYIRTKKK